VKLNNGDRDLLFKVTGCHFVKNIIYFVWKMLPILNSQEAKIFVFEYIEWKVNIQII
jgi:hypothetical protein